MTESAINPNINDRYPYPGVDNSLQGFRDNFSIIKSSLTTAKSEISDLLTNVVRTDTQIIDLHGNVLSNVVLKNTTDYRYTIDGLQTANFDIDYNNGSYQVAQIGADLTINFINFPTDTAETTKLGSMRLHLCADANSRRVQFTASNSIIKYNAGFPFVDTTKLRIPGSATKDPVILDIWQVNNGTPTSTLFIKHDGQFVHYIAKPVPVAATLALTQDTGTNSSDGITSNGQITVSGLEAGATWEYSTNNGNSWTTGAGATFTLSDGTYPAGSVQVKQTNTVGNSSIGSTSLTIVVDTTPPITTPPTTYADSVGSIQNTASVSSKTDDTTPGINIGSVGTNTPALYVDGDLTTAAYDPAAGTLRPVTALAEGIHTFTYTLTDDLGNTSQQSSPFSITIDTTAPVISSIVPSWGSSLVTSEMSTDGTVVISTTGVEDGQLASVTLNSVTYTGTTSSNTANVTIPSAALGVLVDGTTYAITASVQDLAGNQSATASTSFDVNPITVEIDTVTFTTPFADTTITLKPYNPGAGITHIGTAYEVSAYDDFRSLVATSGNDWSFLTSYTIVGILSPATTYYARAKCLNGGSNFGWTAWSPVFQFTTTTAANHPVTGSIIITGNLTVGSVLTADASALADLDILGPFSYSWYSDVDPTIPIPGETSTTYTIRPVDETRNVGCAVTYHDGSGYFEIAVTYVGPITA